MAKTETVADKPAAPMDPSLAIRRNHLQDLLELIASQRQELAHLRELDADRRAMVQIVSDRQPMGLMGGGYASGDDIVARAQRLIFESTEGREAVARSFGEDQPQDEGRP